MNFSVNTLMSMTKKDLVSIIENLSREKDEIFDKAERLQDELNEVETYEDEFYRLEKILDTIDNFKIARTRLDLGIESEREYFEKYLYEILDYATI